MKLNEQTKEDIDRAFKALSAIEDIRSEIKALKRAYPVNYVSADDAVDTCIKIIDRYIGKEGSE